MIIAVRLPISVLLVLLPLFLAPEVSAQNTTTGSSYGYVVGQGPINIFIGNSAGTDTERWYTTSLVQGKSYCLETFRGNSEYNVDVDLDIDLIRASDNAVLSTFDGVSGDPGVGNNSRWTRGCLIAPATQQYYVRLYKCTCGPARTGNIQFRISETSLVSPWWFVSNASGYDGYITLANTTTMTVSVTVTAKGSNGAAIGTNTLSVPPGGNTFLRVSTDFGTPVTAASGSAQIAHNGPPGAIEANITTMSTATGLSFDAPFNVRQGFR